MASSSTPGPHEAAHAASLILRARGAHLDEQLARQGGDPVENRPQAAPGSQLRVLQRSEFNTHGVRCADLISFGQK